MTMKIKMIDNREQPSRTIKGFTPNRQTEESAKLHEIVHKSTEQIEGML